MNEQLASLLLSLGPGGTVVVVSLMIWRHLHRENARQQDREDARLKLIGDGQERIVKVVLQSQKEHLEVVQSTASLLRDAATDIRVATDRLSNHRRTA